MADAAEVQESNALFVAAWKEWARRSPLGAVRTPPGLIAPWCDVALPLLNSTFLDGSVESRAALVERVATAVEDAAGRERVWLLHLCEGLLSPDAREVVEEVASDHGLAVAVPTVGMVTDQLAAPVRPLPTLEMRRVEREATRRDASDLNCAAYHMPLEWGHEALDHGQFWGDPVYAFVGYREGVPVTTATTLVVNDVLYVGLVATAEEHGRHGYGEAVMRHSLAVAAAATGASRTVLHSTAAGLPLYLQMGYREVTRFRGLAPHEGSG